MSLAVCKRGHVLGDVESMAVAKPGMMGNFCPNCSAPVLLKCETCGLPINWQSIPHPDAPPYMWEKYLPDFCVKCQKPYPWASREKRLQALYNLIDFADDLDEPTRFEVMDQIAILSRPEEGGEAEERKIAAGLRLKQLAPKVWDLGKEVLAEVLADAVKRGVGLDGK
jgi:hypothetical protein